MAVWLDDLFDEHPKVQLLHSEVAAWLHVRGLLYCQRHPTTSGRIPKGMVPEMTKLPRPKALAADLVRVGLWEDEGDFFHVHDWEMHNQNAVERGEKLTEEQEIKRHLQASARSEKASKAAKAMHEKRRREQQSSMLGAEAEHAPSTDLSMLGAEAEHARTNASHGRGRASDPSPNPIAQSPPEDLVGVLNGCSEHAAEHAPPAAPVVPANGSEMEILDPEPQVKGNDPETVRWLNIWPVRKLDEARAALALCRKHIAEHIIDEAIGHCIDMKPRPKSPRYLCTIATDWAQQRGANLNDAIVAELVGAEG